MSKPRRKNYIYDRNFIVGSSFALARHSAMTVKKIRFIQNHTKKLCNA